MKFETARPAPLSAPSVENLNWPSELVDPSDGQVIEIGLSSMSEESDPYVSVFDSDGLMDLHESFHLLSGTILHQICRVNSISSESIISNNPWPIL